MDLGPRFRNKPPNRTCQAVRLVPTAPLLTRRRRVSSGHGDKACSGPAGRATKSGRGWTISKENPARASGQIPPWPDHPSVARRRGDLRKADAAGRRAGAGRSRSPGAWAVALRRAPTSERRPPRRLLLRPAGADGFLRGLRQGGDVVAGQRAQHLVRQDQHHLLGRQARETLLQLQARHGLLPRRQAVQQLLQHRVVTLELMNRHLCLLRADLFRREAARLDGPHVAVTEQRTCEAIRFVPTTPFP
jgi:hypothetical protein